MKQINESFSDKYDFAYHYLKHVKTDKSMHSYEDNRFSFMSPQLYERNSLWLANAKVAPSNNESAPIIGYVNQKGYGFKYDRRFKRAVVFDLVTHEVLSFYLMSEESYQSKKQRLYKEELPEAELRTDLPEDNLEEAFEIHDELNPQLFDSNSKLHEDVRELLILIADYFVEKLREDGIPLFVVDYHLLGSNAAYGYNEQSDIDLHIVVDFSKTQQEAELISLLYNYAKSAFNKKYDITVCGHEVELYLEDVNSPAKSMGVYSITKNEWIRTPDKQTAKIYEIENTELYKHWEDRYNNLKEGEELAFLASLYELRQHHLREKGEFSEGNLLFKLFRNNGYIADLKDRIVELANKRLSLDYLSEAIAPRTDKQKRINKALRRLIFGEEARKDWLVHHLDNSYGDNGLKDSSVDKVLFVNRKFKNANLLHHLLTYIADIGGATTLDRFLDLDDLVYAPYIDDDESTIRLAPITLRDAISATLAGSNAFVVKNRLPANRGFEYDLSSTQLARWAEACK